jgi:ribosomal protein S1
MKIHLTVRDLLHVTNNQIQKTRKAGEIVKGLVANAPKFAPIVKNINSKNTNCHEKDMKRENRACNFASFLSGQNFSNLVLEGAGEGRDRETDRERENLISACLVCL